jgi:uncharacterized membrane protein YkvA (DUF1232 family)
MTTEGYLEGFSDQRFWRKVFQVIKQVGKELIEKALMLYFAAQQPDTPKWAKTVIYGALAYFILPADALPDFIPTGGYVDDLGALAAAIATVAIYITPEVKKQAKDKVRDLFGTHAT